MPIVKKYESPNLDLLRSIAVSLVLFRHLYGRFGTQSGLFGDDGPFRIQLIGVLGVWFFFVHTSLVLMFSIEKQARALKFFPMYFSFILRRAFRIFPLSVTTVILVYTISSVWRNNPIVSIAELPLPVFVANLLLIQNIFHFRDAIGPLWTLPIEFQMYLFLPILWLVAIKIGWRWLAFCVWPISVLIAIPAGLAKSISWLGVVNFAPCFISGVISYVLWFRVAHKLKATILPVVLSALFCLYMVLGRNSQTGGAWVVCFALGLSLPWIADSQSMLLNTICHRIAKYSYGIYLLHDICISITGYILGKHVHWIMGVGVSLVSTGLLSMIAYHIIEEPLIRLGAQISKQIFRQAPISTSQAN